MKRLMTICLIIFVVAGSANATPTVYTNRAAWEAAVACYQTAEEDFEDGVLDPGVSVVSTNPIAGIQAGNPLWLGPDNVYFDRLTEPASGGHTTTWSFATPLVGFGAYWHNAGPGGPGTSIELYRNGALVGTISNNIAGTFWGFTNGDFDTIFLKIGNTPGWAETYEMDNMVYSYVPAPGAILLGTIGVGLVGWLRRRRTL